MKKIFLSAIFLCVASAGLFAQGTLRGKITDENGETVIGATVMVKDNHTLWSVADLDGSYSLKLPDSTQRIIVISFISYQPIEDHIALKDGQVRVKNYTLKTAALETKEAVVVAKAVRAKEYYTEMIKKNSATTLDYISSETMKKTGDASVVSAVARVTGVSTHGGFITVRGIGDRYVKTSINGSRIPTLDPFTNNIKLDLFPASLVDNILITKTASPDLPGDWAGAYLSVETKDYPEELSVNFEVSAGYNSQSTFQDVLSSERSKTDWLGYDNSYRDHSHTDFVRTVENPTTYQQLVALGLGPYYASMGVTGENWNSNSDTYFRLGLVQLGLLDPALIYDETAYQQARTAYLTGNYTSDAFKIINAAVPDYGKSFPNNWNTIHKNAPLDFSQGLSVGNQVNFFGKPLGFLVGYRYGNSTRYDQNSSAKRVRYDGQTESVVTSENSIETNGWSALMNLAYKFSPNHSVSLLFMPNFTGINKAQDALDATDSSRFVITKSQFYEQRRQLVYQLKTEHYFPSHRIRSELNASYTRGRSSVPDFKNLQYWKDARVNTYQIGGEIGNGIHRYFRYLSDNLLDSRLSFEIPLGDSAGLARKFKLGGAYQRVDRKSDQYDYALNTSDLSNLTLRDNDITTYFDLSNFDIRSDENNGIPYSTINEYYDESGSPANHTFGNSQVSAGFLMVDYALTKRLRFSGGLRMEVADIYTDVAEYDSLHYRKDDPRRQYSSTYPIVNPGILHDLSWLPSANLIWKVRTDEQAPVNLRLNYSGTTARPGIRELSDVALLDYEYREFVFGNSDLKPVRISNYDIRLESYFKSGDNISLSLFYKKFKDHIELVKSVGLTWQNVDKSQVAGLELEGKKIFLKNFEAGANVALIWSQTKYVRNRTDISEGVKKYIPIDTLTRTMFGQAPYVVNCILTWHARKAGADLTFSYNVQGERLVITSANPDIPDVYEKPRNLLDVRVNKNLGKHFSVNVTLRDLFNAPVKRIYKNWGTVYDEYHYGTSYVLGISYKL